MLALAIEQKVNTKRHRKFVGIAPMTKCWLEADLALLRVKYPDRSVSNSELEQILGRTIGAIQTKARRLGLSRKAWQPFEDKAVRSFYSGKIGTEEVFEITKRSLTAIRARASLLGLTSQPEKWAEDEDDVIRKYYLAVTSTPESVAAQLPGRTWNSIVARASQLQVGSRRKAGLVRKHSFNFRYFKNIDTAERAYWLGFIYADGSIQRNCLRIGLVTEGRIHLQRLADAIGFSGEIRSHRANGTEVYTLNLCKSELVRDLAKHGVSPRKTWSVEYPKWLAEPLHRHFIRGVFDGDGCITVGTTKYKYRVYKTPCMSICGAVPEFLQDIVQTLSDQAGIRPVKVIQRNLRGNPTGTFSFSYSGTPALRVRDFLYGDGGPDMECKRSQFAAFHYSSKRPHDKEHQEQSLAEILDTRGAKLISCYAGHRNSIVVVCDKGHEWRTTPRALREGQWCRHCKDRETGKRMLAKGKENLIKNFKSKGWKLVGAYRGNSYPVKIVCEHEVEFQLMTRSAKLSSACCPCLKKNTLDPRRD